MTTPAVSALKKTFPQASITYVVEEPYRRLVEGNPNLDRVLAIGKKQHLRDFFRLLRAIRNEDYDVVVDFHGGPRAWWLTLFSGADFKVGYKVKYRSFAYTVAHPRGGKNGFVHSVENHLNLIRALGVDLDSAPSLDLPQARETELRGIDEFFRDNRLEGAKVIALHISAGNEFRDWGTANWADLADRLAQVPEVKVVLVGAEADRPAEEEIRARSRAPLLSLVGKVNLIELKETLSRASLFVGPDSGPMHIAASASTPIVALFGPTLPVHFSPWRANAQIVSKELGCRPCRQKKCQFGDFRCLRTITSEEVYKASLRFI
jgi:lipopolysaccharide heptosyltransferase II